MSGKGPGVITMRERALAVLLASLILASAIGPGVLAAVDVEGQVRLSGQPATNGTSYSYDIRDLDSATAPHIEFTGRTATEWDNASAADVGSGGSLGVSIAGDQDPTGPSANGEPVVEITGNEQTMSWSASATNVGSGATKSVSVPGNVDPTGETVEFVGREQTSARTVSAANLANGGTTSYSVGGTSPRAGCLSRSTVIRRRTRGRSRRRTSETVGRSPTLQTAISTRRTTK
ncbi:hypothetical protein VB773_14260 [Haloarculaceae archaeon H-GB2-1]|nr:hypothetical protein [Haloarculaceae archaeon H-GB2-1]